MKLWMDGVWLISKDHLRILEAAEAFIKTHNYVPIRMLSGKSQIKANFNEYLRDLVKLRFIQNFSSTFRLNIGGFDCLAINHFRKLGLEAMGTPIGIGKESDIHIATFKGRNVVIKIHRLGRSSYTKIDERNLKNEDNWFLANCESARNEAEFLKLFACEFIPEYFACNRHMIVMEYLEGYEPLYNITVEKPEIVSRKMLEFIKKLWEQGYVHGDFNEFNVMVLDEDIKVIDFPQCIPVSDPRAKEYLKRDIECVHKFFWKKNFYICDDTMFKDIYETNGIVMDVKRNGLEIFNSKND